MIIITFITATTTIIIFLISDSIKLVFFSSTIPTQHFAIAQK